jgi:hypothetical protein
MTLEPDRYECPDHHADLTGQIEDALTDEGPPVAFRPPPRGPRPFQVIVTCPGTSSAGAHQLTCTGTLTP